jgi:hypothetical protein
MKKILILVIACFIIGIVFLSFEFSKVPEGEAYIVELMSKEYSEYTVKDFPDPLDAAIEVEHKDGRNLTEEEIKGVRDFFNTNYSEGYWRGIRR